MLVARPEGSTEEPNTSNSVKNSHFGDFTSFAAQGYQQQKDIKKQPRVSKTKKANVALT